MIKGETGIVFIRKKENPRVPFVTMEIAGEIIIQIRARFNELPKREVFEFVEKFTGKYGIEYDPFYIIYAEDDEDLEDREDLELYLEDFKKRREMPLFPDDGKRYEQLSLKDCFPECFLQGDKLS